MKLRQKTLITICVTLLVMIAIIYVISRQIILANYELLEEKDIRVNTEQLLSLINDEVEFIKSAAGDWGPWEDTYQFVTDLNTSYQEANLVWGTFENFDMNFMVFFNTADQIVHFKAFDLLTGEQTVLPKSFEAYFSKNKFLLHHENKDKYVIKQGLMLLPEAPLIVASAPIAKSDFQGPYRGSLMFARYLDKAKVDKISEKLRLPIQMYNLNGEPMPEDFELALKFLTGENPVYVQQMNDGIISAYVLIKDVYDFPILLMRIDKSRSIYSQGLATMNYFLFSLLVSGVVFMIMMLLLLEKVVLTRLSNLSKHVINIGKGGTFTERIPIQGKDELSDLSNEINNMLRSLFESTERDRTILENMADGYIETDLEGNVTFFNEAIQKMTGYSVDAIMKMNIGRLQDSETSQRASDATKTVLETGEPVKSVDGMLIRPDGKKCYITASIILKKNSKNEITGFRGFLWDVTEERDATEKREALISELQEALDNVKTLSGMLPICANCKKVRDDSGYWNKIEAYIETRSDALFSHSICPDCMEQLYGEEDWYKKNE